MFRLWRIGAHDFCRFSQKLSIWSTAFYLLLVWLGSYLSNRRQRVRSNQSLSSWKELKGGMPQGSWLDPLSFLVLTDNLTIGCPVYKYVDGSTLSEVLQLKSSNCNVMNFLKNLLDWTGGNDMQLSASVSNLSNGFHLPSNFDKSPGIHVKLLQTVSARGPLRRQQLQLFLRLTSRHVASLRVVLTLFTLDPYAKRWDTGQPCFNI